MSNGTISGTSSAAQKLRNILAANQRKAEEVINIKDFPYSRKRGPRHDYPDWRRNELENEFYKFAKFDDIIIYREKSTGKIVYGWTTYACEDGGVVTKKMRRYIQDMGLAIQKESMTPEDKYEVIGTDYEHVAGYIDVVPEEDYGQFLTYGNQFTQLFQEEHIEVFHPHNVYSTQMDLEKIRELEMDREQLTQQYWSAWNICAENLGEYPSINV